MKTVDCSGSLSFLSAKQRMRLTSLLKTVPVKLMPHEVAGRTGLERADALAILATLRSRRLCRMKLLIYHSCVPETPVGAKPYGSGFPRLPWTCPQCECEVTDPDELSYDFMAFFVHAVAFS